MGRERKKKKERGDQGSPKKKEAGKSEATKGMEMQGGDEVWDIKLGGGYKKNPKWEREKK